MLLDRNLGVEHAPRPYPGIPRFRHSHRVFCYFLKSQRENGKGTHLFYGTANTEGTTLPIPRGLFTCEPPAEAILLRWMMSSWQQPHQRRLAPAILPRWRTILRPTKGETFRRKNRKREGNFLKCALITRVNLITTILESAPVRYQSCSRKIPFQQVSAGPPSHCSGQVKIHSVSGTRESCAWTSTPPDQPSLGAHLCSKGCFSH